MKQESSFDYEQILLKDPLYSEYELDNLDELELLNLLFFVNSNKVFRRLKTIDSYCSICKKHTTFNSEDSCSDELSLLVSNAGMHTKFHAKQDENTLIEELEKINLFIRIFSCPRKPNDPSHNHVYIFRVIGRTLIKIGQNPTIADLSKEEIKKYRKLNPEIYTELNRAIGLSAHGVGIGSFVYLRRIIEKHIVYPEINKLLKEKKISPEQISSKDFKGKINLAKEELPEFLVENPKIY